MTRDNKNISDEHLMAYLAKEADDQLVQKVEDWLSLSDNNVACLNELEKVWTESGKLKVRPVVVDTDLAWSKLSNKIDKADQKNISPDHGKKGFTKLSKTFLRIAAVLIIVFGVWAIIKLSTQEAEKQTLISLNSVVNETLPDGSKVSLNKNSKLVYPEKFKGKTREVEFEGEAFFEIESNKEKPFIIHSENANIWVLGTSFNLKSFANSKEVEVFVKTGVVMLFSIDEKTNDTLSVVLYADEKGVFNKETNQIEKITEVDDNELFWVNRTLIFEETELVKVIELLQDYFNVKIDLQNNDLNYCRLNATFRNETIDEILNVIATSFNLEVIHQEEKTYTLNGEGC
ncbi:MAG: FecR domain-containing protein [Bacteroidota bacterium]